jgi:hypothetical protein
MYHLVGLGVGSVGGRRSCDQCISTCTLYILIFFNVQPLIGNL